jgi:aspartate/methionine/tyrosine aminotransferase
MLLSYLPNSLVVFLMFGWLPAARGVAVVPGSCFYGTLGKSEKTVRFAFAKKVETLDATGKRWLLGEVG